MDAVPSSAESAVSAESAISANSAVSADSAVSAESAISADSAVSAEKQGVAYMAWLKVCCDRFCQCLSSSSLLLPSPAASLRVTVRVMFFSLYVTI